MHVGYGGRNGQRSLEGRSPPGCHWHGVCPIHNRTRCLILAVFSMLLLNNELKTGEQASLGRDLPRTLRGLRRAAPEKILALHWQTSERRTKKEGLDTCVW